MDSPSSDWLSGGPRGPCLSTMWVGGGTETATEVTAGVSLAPVNWEPLRGREPLASLSRLLGGRRSACVTNGRTKASPHLQGPSRPSCLW